MYPEIEPICCIREFIATSNSQKLANWTLLKKKIHPSDAALNLTKTTDYTNLGFKCRIRFRGSFCFNQGENRRNSSAIPRIVNAE